MVAGYIKALMEEKEITVAQLAEDSGVPAATINRIISGQTANPTIQNVADIVVALGGSLDEMMGVRSAGDSSRGLHIYTASWETGMAYRAVIASKDKMIEQLYGSMRRLFWCIIGIVMFIIVMLLLDIMMPDIGWIRRMFSSALTRM